MRNPHLRIPAEDASFHVGGPNASHDPILVRQMLEKRFLDNIKKEADFYSLILFDDQMAATDRHFLSKIS